MNTPAAPQSRPIVVAFPGQGGFRAMENVDACFAPVLFKTLSDQLGKRLSLVAVSHSASDYTHLLKMYDNVNAVISSVGWDSHFFRSGVTPDAFVKQNKGAAIVVATTQFSYGRNHVHTLSNLLGSDISRKDEANMVVRLQVKSIIAMAQSIVACARSQGCEVPELANG